MKKRIIMRAVLLIVFMGFSMTYAQDVENILVNEGFEDGVYEWPWDFYDNTGAPAYVEVVTDDPIEGDYCIHVVVPEAGTNTWDVGVVHRNIVLEQGKQYTFSAFMNFSTNLSIRILTVVLGYQGKLFSIWIVYRFTIC